jgi:uncharacterized protein YxjI
MKDWQEKRNEIAWITKKKKLLFPLQVEKCAFNILSVSTVHGNILNVNFTVKIVMDVAITIYIYLHIEIYALQYFCV